MVIHEEFLFTVDDCNKPIEAKSRKEVHAKLYWHRTTHIWIINQQCQILCQKRSMLKDTNPGKWECFFGGHLAPGQDYQTGALVELREELGITAALHDLIFFHIFKCNAAKEFQAVFLLRWNGDPETLHLEKDEVDRVKWVDRAVLESALVTSPTPTWTRWGYQTRLLKDLKTSFGPETRSARHIKTLIGKHRSSKHSETLPPPHSQ